MKRFRQWVHSVPALHRLDLLIDKFFGDDVPGLAAELTFYLITAFFPFLILVLAILSFTPLTAEETLFRLLRNLPEDAYQLLYHMLTSVSRSLPIILVATAIALWSMSSAIGTIAKAINRFYRVEENRNFIKVRIMGIIFAFLIALSIVLSFALLVFGSLIGHAVVQFFPQGGTIWNTIRFATALILIALLFGTLYRYMPNKRLRFGLIAPGALFSSAAWATASLLFSFYVNNFARYHILYGSLAGIVILVTWLYMTSYIILLGGGLNAILYLRRRTRHKRRRQKKRR